MRLDKYLKVSRLIKRRTVANEACDAGDVYKRQSYDRTVGTQKESLSRERENRCKRGRSRVGKSARQSEDVMRSELK